MGQGTGVNGSTEHVKQSRAAGSAKQGTSAQGQVHGIRVGQARVQGAEGCRTLGKEGRREAAWTKSWASWFCPPYVHPARRSQAEGP